MRYLLLPFALVLCGCPAPKPSPTPDPSPTPTAECQCSIPDAEAPGWQASSLPSDESVWNEAAIKKARDVVGDRCGTKPEETLALVAEQLRKQNVCAARWADAVLVARPNGQLEQFHLVRYEDGCWYNLSNAFKGVWTHPQATTCPGGIR